MRFNSINVTNVRLERCMEALVLANALKNLKVCHEMKGVSLRKRRLGRLMNQEGFRFDCEDWTYRGKKPLFACHSRCEPENQARTVFKLNYNVIGQIRTSSW